MNMPEFCPLRGRRTGIACALIATALIATAFPATTYAQAGKAKVSEKKAQCGLTESSGGIEITGSGKRIGMLRIDSIGQTALTVPQCEQRDN